MHGAEAVARHATRVERQRLADLAEHRLHRVGPEPDDRPARAYRGAHPRSAGSSRIDVNTCVACTSSAPGVTRAKPKTVTPAAFAGSTPIALSSMTTHRAGAAPHARAACRKRSGAGLPRLTSSALKMRPPKRARTPVASHTVAVSPSCGQ